MIAPLVPALYVGRVSHARFGHTTHNFHYPMAMQLVDVDALPELNDSLRLLGYDRWRPFNLLDRDHFDDRTQSIAGNVRALLRAEDAALSRDVAQVMLLTQSRVLGYAFNPVSFFYCMDAAGALLAVVAEVHNTFGQRHAYLLRPEADGEADPVSCNTVVHTRQMHTPDQPSEALSVIQGREKKAFHVSPFFTLEGTYHFRLSRPGPRMNIRIDLFRDGTPLFASRLVLRRQPLSDRTLAGLLLRFPLGSRSLLPGHPLGRSEVAAQRCPLPPRSPVRPRSCT